MAAINFPDSPTLNQEYTDDNGFTWKWNGTVWRGSTGTRQAAIIEVADTAGNFTGEDVEAVLAELADADDTKVAKSGDTMTGNLTIERGTPVITLFDTAGTVDQRKVRLIGNGDQFILRHVNDAGSTLRTWISADHSDAKLDMSGSGSVIVPDASADGEALAYDQSGWQLGAGTITGDPVVTSGNIYHQRDGQKIIRLRDEDGTNRFYYGTISGDVFVLYSYDTARQGLTFDGTNGVVSLAGATEVDVPAISGANQAAQVTAYNATTGQLQIGGHEVGDTGWRDVSADLINGWTGTLHVRRIGDLLMFRTPYGFGLDGSSATGTQFYNFTSGMRPDVSFSSERRYLLHRSNGGALIQGYGVNGIGVGSSSDYGGVEDKYGFYNSVLIMDVRPGDGWPSSLPGVAA